MAKAIRGFVRVRVRFGGRRPGGGGGKCPTFVRTNPTPPPNHPGPSRSLALIMIDEVQPAYRDAFGQTVLLPAVACKR